jgi:hypothetical protein
LVIHSEGTGLKTGEVFLINLHLGCFGNLRELSSVRHRLRRIWIDGRSLQFILNGACLKSLSVSILSKKSEKASLDAKLSTV